ncbi:FAD/NAD(P)-binding domain-containing protein [Lojkania enalia]|uniref:FAD/NAD(P)-binding domain-containing protein n=1 Tax=Lojkania enalia TaxID=147567 RepID=A0A9P4KDG1_9PLEO|nr:FAD/NAD(P)-binding domain-containing protein [Didymosphaeria enalia]
MARSIHPLTWKRGFAEASLHPSPAWADSAYYVSECGEQAHYVAPDGAEKPTSIVTNKHGISSLRNWPTLYNGTAAPNTKLSSWRPSNEVDVLICGAGPFGLAVAMSLARQGITFRIIDKADSPCHSGRADSLQPRALEYLHALGVGHEVTEEGPLVNELILFRNGDKLAHNYVLQSDSRYRGNHIITQGQVEKIFIRDLLRHEVSVERCTTVTNFDVSEDADQTHPIAVKVANAVTGQGETLRAKYLIGADGAQSQIRELLGTPFDGLATECFWAIMDCEVKTDYPHILDFSIVISDEHGGTILVPREQGVTRIYVQVPEKRAVKVADARKRSRKNGSAVGETQVHNHGITPEEVMDQWKKIMTPWMVDFAGPLSWFAVWRVNERVARSFSTPNHRVFIGGDAAHVHSVLGAFGLNSAIYDAMNLSWKLALCLHGAAVPHALLSTYDTERRLFANRVIRFSGAFLRFVCNMDLPLASLRGLGEDMEIHDETPLAPGANSEDARQWLRNFFGRIPRFMQGLGAPIIDTVLSPARETQIAPGKSPAGVYNGVRAPNPRISFSASYASYLYDSMLGINKFHILVFGSDLQGPVRDRIACFLANSLAPGGFFDRFGGENLFNVVLVLKSLPHEAEGLLSGPDLQKLREIATVLYDDRAPDEDAHYCYAVNHARGAVIIVRPDLVVGTTAWPEDTSTVDEYFSSFLIAP